MSADGDRPRIYADEGGSTPMLRVADDRGRERMNERGRCYRLVFGSSSSLSALRESS